MANREGLTYLDYVMKSDKSVQACQMESAGRIRAKGGRLLKYRAGDYVELLSDGDIAIRREANFEAEFQLATAPTAPPTGLAASNQTLTGLRLTWTKGDAAAKTQVYKDDVLIATVAANTELYDVTGLPFTDHAYTFKIRHIRNETETAFAAPLVAYTIPATPAVPVLVSKGATTINVSFTPTTGTKTQPTLDGSNSGGVLAVSTTTKNFMGLTTATQYLIRIKAVGNLSGLSSAASAALTVTTD